MGVRIFQPAVQIQAFHPPKLHCTCFDCRSYSGVSFLWVNNSCSICSSEVSIRKLFPKSVVMWEYIYLTWNYASRADTQVSQQQNTYSVNLLLTLFLPSMVVCTIILLNKRKSQEKCLDRSYYWRQYMKHWAKRKIIKLNKTFWVVVSHH